MFGHAWGQPRHLFSYTCFLPPATWFPCSLTPQKCRTPSLLLKQLPVITDTGRSISLSCDCDIEMSYSWIWLVPCKTLFFPTACPAGMCSSRSICSGNNRPNRAPNSSGSGAHYALCALGVGLIALGIVMIVWTVIPMDGEGSDDTAPSGNSTSIPENGDDDDDERTKSSSVALVLVGVGIVMLLLSICLGVRNKRRAQSRSNQPVTTGFMDHVAGEEQSWVMTSSLHVWNIFESCRRQSGSPAGSWPLHVRHLSETLKECILNQDQSPVSQFLR